MSFKDWVVPATPVEWLFLTLIVIILAFSAPLLYFDYKKRHKK